MVHVATRHEVFAFIIDDKVYDFKLIFVLLKLFWMKFTFVFNLGLPCIPNIINITQLVFESMV